MERPSETITVKDNRTGQTVEIPIEQGRYIDAKYFKQLDCLAKEEASLCIYDAYFLNTAVVRSKISYVDGERGILLYRGYRVEELIEKSNYLEVSFLLIYGHLPDTVFAISVFSL